MTTLNIVSSTPKYKVTDDGLIEMTLTDTANAYADGSNHSKTFTVNPIGNTRLKELLIAEYHRKTKPTYSDLQSEINEDIGIEIPTTSN